MPQWLFGPFIPHSYNDGQSRTDGGLSSTKEKANGEEAFGIEACRGKHKNRTPYKTARD